MTFSEMQDVLMKELRLYHYPVAIKYFTDQAELEKFKASASYFTPKNKVTFCQAELGARSEGETVLLEKEKLGCANAKFTFGWKSMDQDEIASHRKYVRSDEQAEKFILAKPRLPEGEVLAIAISPLADTLFTPDVVHFTCDSLQAYHLAVDYMCAMDIHPLQTNITINSAACGGNVFTKLKKRMNVFLPCSGNYNSGKMERGEINVSIPGDQIGLVVERLLERKSQTGGSSITRKGNPFPGADICKNCPQISFKPAEKDGKGHA